MGNSKLIIRLIDVVFILLFAFISVSQIDSLAIIEPPKSSEASNGAPQSTQTIVVGVTKDGTYLVENGNTILRTIASLRRYLVNVKNETLRMKKQLGVRIRADWNSPVEYGLAVAALCRELGLEKGLDVVQFHTN